MKKIIILCAIILPVIFYDCSEDSTGPANGDTGRIKMLMVDSPADYDEINIVVDRVEVHKSGNGEEGEWFIINNKTRTYDLLELRNGASAVLCDTFLSAGHYTQIRLIIGEGSNIVVNGVTHELIIPSGTQTGLKLIHGFDIVGGVVYELILDFDADKSIILTGNGKYMLKPTVRVMAVSASGSISGVVLPPDETTAIWTIAGGDTVTTYSTLNGDFKLIPLLEGVYDVYISPVNPAYRDTVITNVAVDLRADTDIGTVTIFP